MRIYQSGRQQGKTTFLLEQMRELGPDRAVMVCHDARTAERLGRDEESNPDSTLTRSSFVVAGTEASRHHRKEHVFVDDLEFILARILPLAHTEIVATTSSEFTVIPLPRYPDED